VSGRKKWEEKGRKSRIAGRRINWKNYGEDLTLVRILIEYDLTLVSVKTKEFKLDTLEHGLNEFAWDRPFYCEPNCVAGSAHYDSDRFRCLLSVCLYVAFFTNHFKTSFFGF
jgi:hypothetical protein